jgi:predicted permease
MGAVLTVGGVLLYAALERHSFYNTDDWLFAILSSSFLPALLIGTPLTIVGAATDRMLPTKRARNQGLICWAVAVLSLFLFARFGNVHGWTFSFIFPAFAGFFAGAIYLLRSLRRRT